MLIVTTDRLSAFDVVLPDPIPGKGEVLNSISNFWFARTRAPGAQSPHRPRSGKRSCTTEDERALLAGRAVIVRRLKALPIEAVVRGYLIGSGWKDYQASGSAVRHRAAGRAEAGAAAAAAALHARHQGRSGRARREHLLRERRDASSARTSPRRCATRHLRSTAARPSTRRARGIIIADTKFEFGLDAGGRLTLIDEVVTPDSSRFWPADTYREGTSPPSFDKQYVRDYLETLDWNKKAPGPEAARRDHRRTSEKYREALTRLTGPGAPIG